MGARVPHNTGTFSQCAVERLTAGPGACRRRRQRGFFVAFGYSRDAEDECRAFFKRTGRIVKLLTVQAILDEEHVQKM